MPILAGVFSSSSSFYTVLLFVPSLRLWVITLKGFPSGKCKVIHLINVCWINEWSQDLGRQSQLLIREDGNSCDPTASLMSGGWRGLECFEHTHLFVCLYVCLFLEDCSGREWEQEWDTSKFGICLLRDRPPLRFCEGLADSNSCWDSLLLFLTTLPFFPQLSEGFWRGAE